MTTIIKSYIKKINIYDLVLSICIALCIAQMQRMVFSGNIFGDITENFMKPFSFKNTALFIVVIPLIYNFLPILYKAFFFIIKNLEKDKKQILTSRERILITSIVLGIVWFFYFLSYYPGGIYIDTIVSLDCYQAGIWDGHHPVFYTFLIGKAWDFANHFQKSESWAIGLFFAVQMFVLACEIIGVLVWEIRRGISSKIQILSMAYFIFFPLIPLYGVSIWKDTPFCMAMLFFMMPFLDLCTELRQGEWKKKTVILCIIGFFLVSLTRSNGLYVICFSVGVLFIVTVVRKIKKLILLYGIGAISLLSIFILLNPIYTHLGVIPAPRSDGLCVPLQQICAVVAYDGDISKEQYEKLHILSPQDNIKEYFLPCVADNMRWYSGIDGWYFGSKSFLKLWAELLVKNPKIYVDEYLILTAGYWNIGIENDTCYVQTESWDAERIIQKDYLHEITGLSFKNISTPRHFISGAWFFWVFFISMMFCMKRFGWNSCVYFAPAIGVWITVMIASVISFSFRLIAPLVFILPFVLIIPIILRDSKILESRNI